MCKVNRCICFTRYLSRGVNLTDRCAFLADSYVLSSFPKSVLRIISQELSFIKLFMSQSLFVSVSLDAEGNVCKWCWVKLLLDCSVVMYNLLLYIWSTSIITKSFNLLQTMNYVYCYDTSDTFLLQ